MRRRAFQPILGLAGVTLFATAVAGFNCSGPTGPDDDLPTDRVIVAFDLDRGDEPDDRWSLLSGRVVDDSLELEVGYSGGCREHVLRLFAVDGWIQLPDAGPFPRVGVDLFLSHDANDDACEAALRVTPRFALAPLEEAWRQDFGDGPVLFLLRISDGNVGAATRTFDWSVEGA